MTSDEFVLTLFLYIIMIFATYKFASNQGYQKGKKEKFEKVKKENYSKGFYDGIEHGVNNSVIISNLNFDKLNNGQYYTFVVQNHSYVVFNTMQLELSLKERGVEIDWLGKEVR